MERGRETSFNGRFWFADEPDRVVPGRLDIGGSRPRVELHGALSPFLKELPSDTPGTRAYGPAEPTGPRTLYGELMGSIGRVTIANALQRRHTAMTITVPSATPNEGLQEETLEGDYAILGMHVSGTGECFSAYRFRVRHQDAWAGHSGLSMTMTTRGERTSEIKYTEPAPITAPLPGDFGTLVLEASATISPPRVAGAYVLTETWLKVDLSGQTSVPQAWARYVIPASVLLTMLHARECPPTAFEVRSEENGRWCRIHLPGLGTDPTDVRSSKLDGAPLLDRSRLGLDRLAVWFELCREWSPIPNLIAGAFEATDRTVQNLLLELATAAEGLHRKLYPDARNLTEEQKHEALAGIAGLRIDQDAKQVLRTAMQVYLWDMSFPQRLKALAADVAETVPGVTGKPAKWCNRIRDARNGFAHHLTASEPDTEMIYGYHTLQMSLRWLLAGRLLLQVGVPAEELATAFSDYEPYQQFLRNAQRDLPDVYDSGA